MTWMLPRITDYWDWRSNAVVTLAKRFELIDRDDRISASTEVVDCISRHLDALSPEQIANCAWIMADDLYRSGCNMDYWDDSVADYLRASVRPLLARLSMTGFTLRYFVDNEFAQSPVGLALPVEWLPKWFRAAGFAYICPHQIASKTIQTDGREADAWTAMLPSYLPQARIAASDALTRCRAVGSHFVFLDPGSLGNTAETAFESMTTGVIMAFRNDPPVVGSKCVVKIVPPAT